MDTGRARRGRQKAVLRDGTDLGGQPSEGGVGQAHLGVAPLGMRYEVVDPGNVAGRAVKGVYRAGGDVGHHHACGGVVVCNAISAPI